MKLTDEITEKLFNGSELTEDERLTVIKNDPNLCDGDSVEFLLRLLDRATPPKVSYKSKVMTQEEQVEMNKWLHHVYPGKANEDRRTAAALGYMETFFKEVKKSEPLVEALKYVDQHLNFPYVTLKEAQAAIDEALSKFLGSEGE